MNNNEANANDKAPTNTWADKYWTKENLCFTCGHPRNDHLGEAPLRGMAKSSDSGWCSLPAGTCIFDPCNCVAFVESSRLVIVDYTDGLYTMHLAESAYERESAIELDERDWQRYIEFSRIAAGWDAYLRDLDNKARAHWPGLERYEKAYGPSSSRSRY